MVRLIAKNLRLIIKSADYLFSLLCFFGGGIFFLISCSLYKKRTINSSDKIFFIASGIPIKKPMFSDKKYQEEWHQSLQKQFLSFGNAQTYVYYSSSDAPQESYKLTKNVIAINAPAFKKRLGFTRTINTLSFWHDFVIIRQLLKRLCLSTVVCYAPSDRLLLCAFLKLFLGVKLYASVMGNADLAWSEHAYNNKKIKKLILYIYEKIIAFFFFQQADLVIAYNNHVGDYALCNGASPEKIRRTRIYPCITEFDEEKVIPKNELEGFPKAKRNIIMWSRFAYEKKIPFALKGAIQALEKNSDLGLCVIGYGPMYDDIKKIIDASTVRDRISLIGFTPSFRLLSYIYHADIALIPLGGFAMLEACLLKKPIVCFDIEWHHELLTDGYSGYFADYPDSSMVCEKILEALSEPDEAKIRGERAHQRFKLLFDTERISNREKIIFEKYSNKNL
jgi:glycosyltransferase involved in cell wall biosynthesis